MVEVSQLQARKDLAEARERVLCCIQMREEMDNTPEGDPLDEQVRRQADAAFFQAEEQLVAARDRARRAGVL